MTLHFDHAVIAVPDLEIAIRDYQALGFTVIKGGVHANRATHNALIVFGNATYLELLAPTGEAPTQGQQNFSRLSWREGLTGFALRSDDLEAEAVRLRGEGLMIGEVTPGGRRRPDGKVLEWKTALLDDSFAPFLIQDVTPQAWRIPGDPAITTHPNHVVGVRGVVIAVGDMEHASNHYARLLGLRPDSALNGISLREADSEEGLYAVRLVCEESPASYFDPERTHGVRFEQVTNR